MAAHMDSGARVLHNPFRMGRWYERRWLRWALTVAIIGVLAGNVVGFLLVGDRADPVTVDTALARYRAAAGAPAPAATVAAIAGDPSAGTVASSTGGTTAPGDPTGDAAPVGAGQRGIGAVGGTLPTEPDPAANASPLPPAGVYVYDTAGSESVDVTLHGDHTYPAQSTVTLTTTPCGMNMHWQPIEQRYDDYGICTAGGGALTLASINAHHEFFGTAVTRSYTCDGVYVRPPTDEPGTTVQGTCRNDSDTSAITTTVVGMEGVVVGGVAMSAIHEHMEFHISGGTNGVQTADFWLQPSDGLPLRLVLTTDARTGTPIGNAHFVEHADLRLTSTTPLQ